MNDKNLGYGLTAIPKEKNPVQSGQSGSSVAILLKPLYDLVEVGKNIVKLLTGSIVVKFPENLYPPVGSETVDLRALESVEPNSKRVILLFKAPDGMTVRFIKYAVFTDILEAKDVLFNPKIDNNRILRYHGDPNDNFKINLAIGPDLSDNCCINCDFELKSGQTLTVEVENNTAVQAPIGVRFVGYKINQNKSSRSFGG